MAAGAFSCGGVFLSSASEGEHRSENHGHNLVRDGNFAGRSPPADRRSRGSRAAAERVRSGRMLDRRGGLDDQMRVQTNMSLLIGTFTIGLHPLAAGPGRVHQLPDFCVSRYHGRRIGHAWRGGRRDSDGARHESDCWHRWLPSPPECSRELAPARSIPASRSTRCSREFW